MSAATIEFPHLTLDDLPLIRRWLNMPHVYEWWGVASGPGSLGGPGDAAATEAQVYEKYAPGVDPEAVGTQRHVITVDARPVGLIQWYALADEAAYAAEIGEAEPGGVGIDLLIGEPDRVDRGLGPAALDRFVTEIVFADPTITRAIGAPHPDNVRSCRAFEKAGFVFVRDAVVADSGPERVHVRRR